MIRIYTLAKDLGEKFSIEVKSADLANEIRALPEFASIRDTIKSHASTIEDDVAEKVTRIYQDRVEGPKKKATADEVARLKAEEARRREEITLRRKQMEQQRGREQGSVTPPIELARLQREAEMRRRQEAPKAKGPVLPTAVPPRPIPSIPLARPKIAPIAVPGKAPSVVPPLGRPVAPAAAAPRVEAKAATPPPVAAAPVADAPPAATPPPAPPTTAAIVQPAKVMVRPSAPAAQLRSSGGTTGFVGAPTGAPQPSKERSEFVAKVNLRADGQPLPPKTPNFGMDSPFRLRPPAPPRAPAPPPRSGSGSPPPAGRGRPTFGSDAPRTGDRRPGSTGAPPPRRRPDDARGPGGKPGELVLPEIGVMTLKGNQRRGRVGDKAKGSNPPPAKKKALKTILHDEFEVKPSKVYGLADEFRRPIASAKRGDGRSAGGRDRSFQGGRSAKGPAAPTGPIRIGSMITVGQFAEKLGVPVADIIKRLMLMGQMITINQFMDADACEVLAQEFGIEVVVETEGDEQDIEAYLPVEAADGLVHRPPVVTIMGHVDHGKTTLLDAYRSSTVVSQEFGGITQHIGAYRVETQRGVVVFLDTPGHAAFTSMRARGASVTDIVVLVVAADDGVMPQTVEAINHAREASVPIIVAINKMDLPGANPDRVRTELMQYSILPESLGGDNIFVEISAKKGTNLDQLLELILLQADVLELKADPACHAQGTIIESHIDPLRGAVATVLVSKGTLHGGDPFVVGNQSGRVRLMIDDRGKQVQEAGPSYPVEVIGLTGAPDVGETFLALPEERLAREIASRRADRRRLRDFASGGPTRHVTLEGLHELVSAGKLKELKVILRADVQGSLEAVAQSIQKLSNEEVKVRILQQATGAVTESDVTLASASDAIVVGFNVRPDPAAAALAEQEGIEIKTYRIIYELIEEFQKAIIGMLDKRYKEVQTGRVEIRQLFRVSRLGTIAGCMVLTGEITRNSVVRLIRDGVVVYEGKLASLRRVKDDVAKVAAGYECGIMLERFSDFKEGDIIEAYKMEEVPAELAAT